MTVRNCVLQLVLTTAVGLSVTGTSHAQEASQPVRLILDWAWRPHHAPIALGIERGYFAEVGIDLAVEQGRGSATASILLGQRQFDLAHVNVTNAAQAISKGVPIRSVAVYQHRSAASFVGIKGRVDLADASSLDDLRIGSTPGGSDGLSLSIFARSIGKTIEDFNVVGIEGSGKTAALLQSQVDVVSGDSYAYDALVRAAGEEPEIMLLAEFGVPLLGFGIATNEQFAADNPEAIRRFLGALKTSYAEAVADPEAACGVLKVRFEVPGETAACVRYFTNLVALSQAADDAAWGHQSVQEWDVMIAAMTAVGEISSSKQASEYWTDDFQP